MNRFLMAVAVAALLVGCGSPVKLDNVPVEDLSGKKVLPGGAGAGTPKTDTTNVAKSDVTQVDLSKSARTVLHLLVHELSILITTASRSSQNISQ